MARVTSSSPASDQPFGWKVHEVEFDTTDATTGTLDIAVATLPVDTRVLSMQVQPVLVDAGATTVTVDLEANAGGTNVLVGASDNLGTVHAVEVSSAAELILLNTALDAAAVTINAEVTIGGTATGTTKFLVAYECGRTSY